MSDDVKRWHLYEINDHEFKLRQQNWMLPKGEQHSIGLFVAAFDHEVSVEALQTALRESHAREAKLRELLTDVTNPDKYPPRDNRLAQSILDIAREALKKGTKP